MLGCLCVLLTDSGSHSVFGRDAVVAMSQTRLNRASDRAEVEKRGTGRGIPYTEFSNRFPSSDDAVGVRWTLTIGSRFHRDGGCVLIRFAVPETSPTNTTPSIIEETFWNKN